MEDRLTPGLYLEMADEPAPAEGVSVWENVRPGRDELPRELPEFRYLHIREVGDDFVGAGGGLHFRRCPRPAQGRLTGNPTLGLLLVLISPTTSDGAQALRDWADFVHISHIAAAGVPGYTMVTPYENATGGDPRFMHLYEMDTDDPEASFQAMTPLVTERIGATDTPYWQAWANTPELRIMYVNTFRRLGERPSG
jgi:hypothetical protein